MDYAFNKRVALASPVTLWSVLKTVAFSWQQDVLTDQAKTLFDLSKELYSRLSTLSEHADKLRRSIDSTVNSYNQFANSLETRVLVTARKLNALDESKVIGTAATIETGAKQLTAIEMELAALDELEGVQPARTRAPRLPPSRQEDRLARTSQPERPDARPEGRHRLSVARIAITTTAPSHGALDVPRLGGFLLDRRRELRLVETRVGAVGHEQLVVRPLLDDRAVLHHEDEVGVADRREPVGDHEARAVLAQRAASPAARAPRCGCRPSSSPRRG